MMDEYRKDVSIVTIKKLCDGLNITLGEFFPPRSSAAWSRKLNSVRFLRKHKKAREDSRAFCVLSGFFYTTVRSDTFTAVQSPFRSSTARSPFNSSTV